MSIRYHVIGFGLGQFDRVKGEAGCIRSDVAGKHLAAGPFAPNLQLLYGSSPERITGDEKNTFALVAKLGRQLADRGRLTGSVNADHEDDVRLVSGFDVEFAGNRREDALDLSGKDLANLIRRDALIVAPARDALGDTHSRVDAEISLNEDVLQIIQIRSFELALGEDAGDAFG